MTLTAGVWLRMVGLGSNDFGSTWEVSFVGLEVGPLSWCLFVGVIEATKTPIRISDPRLRFQKMVSLRMCLRSMWDHGKCFRCLL
jgi:hypothetical protein